MIFKDDLPAIAEHLQLDEIHKTIKNFALMFPENFKKTGIIVCDKCNGSGLDVQVNEKTGVTPWAPGTYCKHCAGVGYYGFTTIYGSFYICKECGGRGCKRCGKKGILDWISNVMGGKS